MIAPGSLSPIDLSRVRDLNYDHHRRMTEDYHRLVAAGIHRDTTFQNDTAYRDMFALGPVPADGIHAILELGSASGGQWPVLSQLFPEAALTGIDLFEPEVVAAAARGLDIHLGFIEELPFPDASFDLVCSRHVMEHLGNVVQGMAEIRRVLRPGGWVAAATPHYWPDIEPAHLNQLNVEEWVREYEHAGFEVVGRKVYRRVPEDAGSEEGHVVARRPFRSW